jgi:hypothetical protein
MTDGNHCDRRRFRGRGGGNTGCHLFCARATSFGDAPFPLALGLGRGPNPNADRLSHVKLKKVTIVWHIR